MELLRRVVPLALASLAFLAPARAWADGNACANAAEQAQDLRHKKRFLAAREQVLLCVAEACPKVVRDDCHQWLAQLDGLIPSVVVHARDEAGRDRVRVTLAIDGAVVAQSLDGVAIRLDPGPHLLRLEAEGMSPVEQEVLLAQGEQARRVEITLRSTTRDAAPVATTPARPPVASPLPVVETRSSSPWPWIVGGVGVASLATFGALQIVARGEHDDLQAGCGKTSSCPSDEVDALRTKFQLSAVALGVGVVALGAAAVLFLVQPKGGTRAAHALSLTAPLRF